MLFFVLLWEIQERERLCGKDTGKRTSLWQGYRLRNVCGGFTEIDKRKEGKKRMRQVGNVEIPQSAFMAVLKLDEE